MQLRLRLLSQNIFGFQNDSNTLRRDSLWYSWKGRRVSISNHPNNLESRNHFSSLCAKIVLDCSNLFGKAKYMCLQSRKQETIVTYRPNTHKDTYVNIISVWYERRETTIPSTFIGQSIHLSLVKQSFHWTSSNNV